MLTAHHCLVALSKEQVHHSWRDTSEEISGKHSDAAHLMGAVLKFNFQLLDLAPSVNCVFALLVCEANA